jgi:hypothetical protein
MAAEPRPRILPKIGSGQRGNALRFRVLWPVILGLLLGSLAACADNAMREARARRQAFLAGLVGQTEADAIRALGLPQQTYEVDGHRFLAYNQPAPFSDFSFGPPVAICQTTVEIYQGKVQSASMHGYC